MNFSINHIISPYLDYQNFFSLAENLKIKNVEIRNDLHRLDFKKIDTKLINKLSKQYNINIISINALQKFNIWNDERKNELISLCEIAKEINCKGIVLVPLNTNEFVEKKERLIILNKALKAINPIISNYNIKGLIEPLGFKSSSLRYKSEVVELLDKSDFKENFKLVHDTFHHFVAQEASIFPDHTSLVHISAISDKKIEINNFSDNLRGLIGDYDRINNVDQIRFILEKGYDGPFSFEPFSDKIHKSKNKIELINQSIRYLKKSII